MENRWKDLGEKKGKLGVVSNRGKVRGANHHTNDHCSSIW